MKFNTKEEVQQFATSLRKELKAIQQAAKSPSYNETLEIVARLAKFKNWQALSASLEADTNVPAPVLVEKVGPKYPLVNNGQFDFTEPGVGAMPLSPHFEILTGTYEILYGEAAVYEATRNADGGSLETTYDSTGTEIFWDDQKTAKAADGSDIWLDEAGVEYPQSQIVLASAPFIIEEAPVRQALVDAYVEFYHNNATDELKLDLVKAKRYTLGAGRIIGFSLTDQEKVAVVAAIEP